MKVLGLALGAFFVVLAAGLAQAPNQPAGPQPISPPEPPLIPDEFGRPISHLLQGTWKAKLTDSDSFKDSVWLFSPETLTIKQARATLVTPYTIAASDGTPSSYIKTKEVSYTIYSPEKGRQTVKKTFPYSARFFSTRFALEFEVLSQKWTATIAKVDDQTALMRLKQEQGDSILVVLCKESPKVSSR